MVSIFRRTKYNKLPQIMLPSVIARLRIYFTDENNIC